MAETPEMSEMSPGLSQADAKRLAEIRDFVSPADTVTDRVFLLRIIDALAERARTVSEPSASAPFPCDRCAGKGWISPAVSGETRGLEVDTARLAHARLTRFPCNRCGGTGDRKGNRDFADGLDAGLAAITAAETPAIRQCLEIARKNQNAHPLEREDIAAAIERLLEKSAAGETR